MSNINDFQIDLELKQLVTNIVVSKLESINIEMVENERIWFTNECSGELIENILEAVNIWTTKKLN